MSRFALNQEESSRRNLGNVIRWYREQRHFTQHRVADICSTSIKTVDAWERGEAIPPDWQWGKLINVMHRDLRDYRALRMRAQAEEAQEGKTSSSDIAPITQSLGDKLREAQSDEQSEDEPMDDVEAESKLETSSAAATTAESASIVPLRVVPKSAHNIKSSRAQRVEFVRNILRSRPNAKLGGADGIDVMLRRTFGYGMTYELFYRIQSEVHAECRAPHLHDHEKTPPVPPPEKQQRVVPLAAKLAAPPASATATRDVSGEISAVLAMLRDSIPELAELHVFNVNGKLRCEFKLREVKTIETDGSLTV